MMEHVLADIESRVQTALAASPIFALRELRVERQDSSLRLRGLVGSFYHKQLAQEVFRSLAGNLAVINSVAVCAEQKRRKNQSRDTRRKLSRGRTTDSVSSATRDTGGSSHAGDVLGRIWPGRPHEEVTVEKLSQVFEAETATNPIPIVDLQAWAARIRRAVRRETRGGVSQLKIEIDPRGVHLRGRCRSFYCKQLAQQAAMRLAGDTPLDNQIEVRER